MINHKQKILSCQQSLDQSLKNRRRNQERQMSRDAPAEEVSTKHLVSSSLKPTHDFSLVVSGDGNTHDDSTYDSSMVLHCNDSCTSHRSKGCQAEGPCDQKRARLDDHKRSAENRRHRPHCHSLGYEGQACGLNCKSKNSQTPSLEEIKEATLRVILAGTSKAFSEKSLFTKRPEH